MPLTNCFSLFAGVLFLIKVTILVFSHGETPPSPASRFFELCANFIIEFITGLVPFSSKYFSGWLWLSQELQRISQNSHSLCSSRRTVVRRKMLRYFRYSIKLGLSVSSCRLSCRLNTCDTLCGLRVVEVSSRILVDLFHLGTSLETNAFFLSEVILRSCSFFPTTSSVCVMQGRGPQ